MVDERVLWAKTDSATFEVVYDGGYSEVYKTFLPDDISRAHQQLGDIRTSSAYQENPLQKDSQRSLFWREYFLLKAFQGSGYVPTLIKIDSDNLRIHMECLNYATFQDELAKMTSEEEILQATRQMVGFLGTFQDYTSPSLDRIMKIANDQRVRLKRRPFTEEVHTYEKYLVSVISQYGLRFLDDLGDAVHSEAFITQYGARKEAVSAFLRPRANFTRRLKALVALEREAVGEGECFSLGDWRPQNIFCSGSGDQREGKALCDFDKVQLHGNAPYYDLATGIFHHHLLPLTPQKVDFAVNTARDFFTDRGYKGEALNDNMALFVGESVLSVLRMLGVRSAMTYSAIRRFVPIVLEGEPDKDHFIVQRDLSSLELLLKGLTRKGRLYRSAVEPSKRHSNYVIRQAETIRRMLDSTGVRSDQLLEHFAEREDGTR